MLYCLMDGYARNSTELAVVADVSPSTASVHLYRLKAAGLVKVLVQGKHHYYSLDGNEVAQTLEALSVLAGSPRRKFVPHTPSRLCVARTCYDHLAGAVGVSLHDRLKVMGCLREKDGDRAYDLTPKGVKLFESLGVDVEATLSLRRRFAFPCLDWSERRPHLGGGLGAALLKVVLKKKWVTQDLDSRALAVTGAGQREMLSQFGLQIERGGRQ